MDKQPTYKEMFAYTNQHLESGAIAVITNGDIYFDASIGCVRLGAKIKAQRRLALALSRRHSPLCGNLPDHHNNYVSLFDLCRQYTQAHDYFVFAPPVPESLLPEVDHTQNVAYGAENVVIFELRAAGFAVQNTCFTIRGYHNHCVEDRHSSPSKTVSKIPGHYRHAIAYPSGKHRACSDMFVY